MNNEVAPSGPAPTAEGLAGATFTGIEDQGPVTLSGGKWEGQPLIEGGASVPALWLSEGFHLTGDLDQDGADDSQVSGTASLSMLAGTVWVRRKVDGQEGDALPAQGTRTFGSGKVSGSTGCNHYQGPVSEGQSATSLVIGPLITTRMACPEPRMAREHTFLEKLGQAEVFQFLSDDLVLSGPNGALSRLS